MYINLLIFCCTSNIKSSLKMCPVASVDVQYLYSFNLIQSVTSRKDWLATTKSVVMTGESVTAQRDGNRGSAGWQPNLGLL